MQKRVLYAEDDADDRQFLADAITAIDESIEVIFAENGLEAIDTLDSLKLNRELPCAIILDLNMPYLNGKQILSKIKSDPELNAVSVYIFTSGSNPNDKLYFDELGIEMITKPADALNFRRFAKHMIRECIE